MGYVSIITLRNTLFCFTTCSNHLTSTVIKEAKAAILQSVLAIHYYVSRSILRSLHSQNIIQFAMYRVIQMESGPGKTVVFPAFAMLCVATRESEQHALSRRRRSTLFYIRDV